MKVRKGLVLGAIVAANIVGIIFLAYFLIPFLMHDTTVNSPTAVLPFKEAWDSAGMVITIALVPLFALNLAAFYTLKRRRELYNILFFVPSFICFVAMLSYISTMLA